MFIPHTHTLSLSIYLLSTSKRRVDQQVISGNQDFPEGGFDGFLQAIVCKKVCFITLVNYRRLYTHVSCIGGWLEGCVTEAVALFI